MNKAFSLVELSIVLVILGLLTGGILAGQNLIRAAELRSVATEMQTYQTAAMTFRDKYLSIPGDIKNASDFWGYPGNNSANCPATAGTGTQTCNGNGDGILSVAPAANQYGEKFLFWQHLANAGVNIPKSRMSNAGWGISYVTAGSSFNFAIDYRNHYVFGSQNTGDNVSSAPVIKPEELWNIDKKMDDGRPGRGKVVALFWDDCTDATANTQLDANYLLTETDAVCAIRAINGLN